MGFDLVDLVILAATLIGVANGYRRGFWLSSAQYTGLVGGLVLGAAAATPVLNYLEIHNPSARPLGAALVLVIGGSRGARSAAGAQLSRDPHPQPAPLGRSAVAGARRAPGLLHRFPPRGADPAPHP